MAVPVATLGSAILVLVTKKWHENWTGDFEDSGVQKHHVGCPPRVGVLPIMVGILLGVYFLDSNAGTGAAADLLRWMIWASVPVVLLGLADDITKKIPPRVRLLGAVASGALGLAFLGNRVMGIDIPFVDSLIAFPPISVAITLLLVCGFTNAMNIVDGLNGLAGGLAMLMLCATAVVAARLGDTLVLEICVVVALAVGGFLLVNFPRGLLFLGDGGAYAIGFLLVQIWLLLVQRNPSVTPWFVVAVAFLPTMETIFSMYRRGIRRGRNRRWTMADHLHLHSLVYRRRAVPIASRLPWPEEWLPNAGAAMVVASFGALPAMAAVIDPTSPIWAICVVLASMLAYLSWYRRLATFRKVVRPKGAESVDIAAEPDAEAKG